MGFFRVLTVIIEFPILVKASFSFPGCLILLFGNLRDLCFVYAREGKGEIILAVGVKLAVICCNVLSELFFLEFPYIQLLARVLKHVNIDRQIDSWLWKSTTTHALNCSHVSLRKVIRHLSLSHVKCLAESTVSTVSRRLSSSVISLNFIIVRVVGFGAGGVTLDNLWEFCN